MTTEAELLANLPADGVRVFRLRDTRCYQATTQDGSTYWSFNHDRGEWSGPCSGVEDGIKFYTDDSDWTEITPPAATLPDPAGDLPDGTRVRVTCEGTTKGWQYGAGRVYGGDADPQDYATFNSNADCVTIEVLALPEPPKPSALEGEPGSRWLDPETGGVYYRTDAIQDHDPALILIKGPWSEASWQVFTADARVSAVLARLVPADVADHG